MNFTTAQQIIYGAVMATPDPVSVYDREFNDTAQRQHEIQKEIASLADKYVNFWGFNDYMEALGSTDEQNEKLLVDLVRKKDDTELGRHVRHLIEAYASRIAERQV